jgi:chemotaxis protein MotB
MRMGKAPWDADPDIQAMTSGARAGGAGRLGKTLAWALGIIGLTILLAFYVPLSQAHGVLLEQHKSLNDKAKELERSVLAANTALKAAEAQRDELEAREKQKQAQAAALKQRSESVRGAMSAVLQKSAKKGPSAIGTSADAVVVALADSLVFAPKKLDVTADGAQLLCELQKAAGGRPLTVSAVVDPKAAIPQLKADYPGIWQISAARTASAAEALEEKCGVPRARLKASAQPQSKVNFEGSKPPPGHVAIEIDFSEPG